MESTGHSGKNVTAFVANKSVEVRAHIFLLILQYTMFGEALVKGILLGIDPPQQYF